MGLSVLFEIFGVLIKPLFDPGVIITEVFRIPSPKEGIVFGFMGFSTVRIIAGYLTVTDS
jgi:hypothetical protein